MKNNPLYLPNGRGQSKQPFFPVPFVFTIAEVEVGKQEALDLSAGKEYGFVGMKLTGYGMNFTTNSSLSYRAKFQVRLGEDSSCSMNSSYSLARSSFLGFGTPPQQKRFVARDCFVEADRLPFPLNTNLLLTINGVDSVSQFLLYGELLPSLAEFSL